MTLFLILTIVLLSAFSNGSGIHKKMTDEELRSVFKTSHNIVPEYEVVPVAHMAHERSNPELPHQIVQLSGFKQDIKLYLEPIDGFLAGPETPMWEARGDRSSFYDIKYTKIPNTMKERTYFYQDLYNAAAIASTVDENGKMLFEGTIGDDYVIQPLPERLRKEFIRNKRSLHEDFFSRSNRTVNHYNLQYTHHHILYKKNETLTGGIRGKTAPNTVGKQSFRWKRSTNETKDEIIRQTVYPQILVVVDYSRYISLKTFDEVRRYVISFWNAVDLRYRIFLEPKIRLSIAGIIVVTEPDGAPYIKKARYYNDCNPNILDMDEALDSAADYLYLEVTKGPKRFDFDNIDVVMIMTKLDLCSNEPASNDWDCTTSGYAFEKGACTQSNDREQMNFVAIVEDWGGYAGVIPATHELGHLMGAAHDSSDKNECPISHGYIMAGKLLFNERAFHWSKCSVKSFQEFFKTSNQRAECLLNVPKIRKTVPRLLPGEILVRDEQCDRIKGSFACKDNNKNCHTLECYNIDGQCAQVATVAEGTSCGDEHYCLNGKCINRTAKEILLEFVTVPSKLSETQSGYFGKDINQTSY